MSNNDDGVNYVVRGPNYDDFTTTDRGKAIEVANGRTQNTGARSNVYRVETTMVWEGQSLAELAEEAAYHRAARG